MSGEKESIRMHVRWMIRRDMPDVLRIETRSHDYPWCEEDFLRCLRNRNCIGMVAEGLLYPREERERRTADLARAIWMQEGQPEGRASIHWQVAEERLAKWNEKVVGFMIYELHKSKLHLLNFVVHPDCRFRSVGTQLMEKLASKLSSHRRTRIVTEIRETNMEGQLFLRSFGFRATGVSRQFYDDTGEDAYIMEYHLKPPLEELLPAAIKERLRLQFAA